VEPPQGIHMEREAGTGILGSVLRKHLAELKAVPIQELVATRQQKFRNIAQFYTQS
jgi:acetyl-CoA carboxylase carboxyl transferase subunit alpha